MPANSEYSMTRSDATDLSGIAQFDLAMRREALTSYLQRNGSQRLVEFTAQLIGMANSVAENCAEMSDLVLIVECGVHPDKFISVNLPTIIGACQGVMIASKCDPAGACHGCAYRLGSIANQSPITTCDAEFMAHDQKGFMCHAHLDAEGEPIKVCVGHARAAKP
ncbi:MULTISPECIES: hypothetical protein [unclassified Pseudomonas]|uniref:hypothetical protein n=1 Tax=unclassified Pseudomonas TaxID=196821 RepID=UPI0015A2E27C|nr:MULTISPECIES: hypothetical protein [unclassified Pseudomonas]NWC92671.1 hypothetical protein [Pseudomonas sp. IPO3779]NWD17385.1 hypothetical protein [Pseudomonas sp. IPO3778]